jgi:hypothetical protein
MLTDKQKQTMQYAADLLGQVARELEALYDDIPEGFAQDIVGEAQENAYDGMVQLRALADGHGPQS